MNAEDWKWRNELDKKLEKIATIVLDDKMGVRTAVEGLRKDLDQVKKDINDLKNSNNLAAKDINTIQKNWSTIATVGLAIFSIGFNIYISKVYEGKFRTTADEISILTTRSAISNIKVH